MKPEVNQRKVNIRWEGQRGNLSKILEEVLQKIDSWSSPWEQPLSLASKKAKARNVNYTSIIACHCFWNSWMQMNFIATACTSAICSYIRMQILCYINGELNCWDYHEFLGLQKFESYPPCDMLLIHAVTGWDLNFLTFQTSLEASRFCDVTSTQLWLVKSFIFKQHRIFQFLLASKKVSKSDGRPFIGKI